MLFQCGSTENKNVYFDCYVEKKNVCKLWCFQTFENWKLKPFQQKLQLNNLWRFIRLIHVVIQLCVRAEHKFESFLSDQNCPSFQFKKYVFELNF